MSPRPWQEAYDDFNTRVLPVLKQHGRTIGAAASGGDALAHQIVQHYALLARSFDPVNAHLVGQNLDAWLKAQAAPAPQGGA